jgi:hypothetical protein
MAVSSSGRYLASSSGQAKIVIDEKDSTPPNGQIRVWDTTTYQCVANLFAGNIFIIAFVFNDMHIFPFFFI